MNTQGSKHLSDGPRKKRVRVGFITTSFPIATNEPSGIFVKRLVETIGKGLDITVLTPDSHRIGTENETEGFHLSAFRYAPKNWQRLAHEPGGIPDSLRRRDPALFLAPLIIISMCWNAWRLAGQVELIHGNWSGPAVIGALAARIRNKPAIATLRGEDLTRARQSKLFRLILWSCIKLNRHIVCVSEAMHRDLTVNFPKFADRFSFIPNGVTSPPSRRHNPSDGTLRILSVGSLIARKRIDVIISAMGQLKSPNSVRLRIVGDGPLAKYLREFAQNRGLDHSVEFIGQVSPEEVASHLGWADLFVLASESEGRPNVLLEAMAASLPTISSDIDGVRELIEERYGLLYAMGDPTQLAEKIQFVIDNPKDAFNYGRLARQRIDQLGLTWENAAAAYTRLYRQFTA